MIVLIDQVKLNYWKSRLKNVQRENWERPVSVEMRPESLKWFIDTIEYLQSLEKS